MFQKDSQEEFKMANKNGIAKVETTTSSDFLTKIRSLVKGLEQSEAYYVALDYTSKTEGALSWLLSVKAEKDHILVTRKFEFNASDMIGDIINRRVNALERVAYDINVADVLNELESVAWCCRLD